jgi:hypothetical protein
MSAGKWLAGAVLGALGCGRTQTELGDFGCTTDLDCKGDRVCVEGSCEDRALPGANGGQSGAGGASSGAGSSSGGAAGAGARGAEGGMSSGGTPNGTGGSSGSAGVEVGRDPVRLEVGASALAVDPVRGKLYAVVRSDAPAYANELVVIDAEHATIEASVPVGPEPNVLAISDDATRLWVGLRGIGYDASGTLREVDLTQWPPEPGRQYPVPSLSYHREGGTFAARLVVLPGRPESVAVSLDCSGCLLDELVVLDSGIPRPNRTSRESVPEVTAGPSGYLFAFNDEDTGHVFSTIVVDEAGATQTPYFGLIGGFANRIVYDAGYVVASSGHVLDVSVPESPIRIGTFAYEGEVVPHAERGEVVMLSYAVETSFRDTRNDTNPLVLRRLNLSSFRADLEKPLAGQYAEFFDFVEVKPGLFAFIDLKGEDYNSLNPKDSSVYLFAVPDVED